ncbi:MAG TPA: ribosome recycling factor [Geobacterales bacterium]|jgi:ribosome recycling factor|nr:ribosome recycling factor [Geobacterales bacterium]
MAAGSFDIKEIEKRMKGAVSALKSEFGGLRTGRASTTLLDPLMVNTSYGAKMPIHQVASINAPEPRLITVQVWDKSNLHAVDKAIRESDLGLNPVVDGLTLRLPIPELNQERRQELVKIARKYTEQARVAARNVRKDGMDQIKKLEKDGKISEDDSGSLHTKVQDLTDRTIKEIDGLLSGKEHEIMQV